MKPCRIFVLCIFAILLANFAYAATVHGTVYDLSLRKVSNARVEIDTSPKQFIIAQNGSYSFNVPNGAYTIKAQLMQKNSVIASVQENITIKQDGSYVLDLILFPNIEEGVEDIGVDVEENILDGDGNSAILTGFIAIAVILAAVYFMKKRMHKPEAKETMQEEKFEDDLEHIIKIINEE